MAIILTFKLQLYRGLTLYPFILIKNKADKNNAELINHEKIHIQQQKELLVIGFYIWYILDYLIKFLKYKKHYIAYRNIIFEREAYANQSNLYYLKSRKNWAFLKK